MGDGRLIGWPDPAPTRGARSPWIPTARTRWVLASAGLVLLAGLLLGSRVGAAGGYGSTTSSGQLLELTAPASALLLSASLWRYSGSLRFGLAVAGAATWAAGEILGVVDMVPNRTVGAVYPVLGAGRTAWA